MFFSALNRLIYKILIDPLLSTSHKRIAELILPGSLVIDIGCGPGTLVFRLAKSAAMVTGIDLSVPMINGANRAKERMSLNNVLFRVNDASDLGMYMDNEFDYSTISMAVHQFPDDVATGVLKEMYRISREVVILDYMYPVRRNIPGMLVRVIEWIAGGDHFKNFRKYIQNGGIEHYLNAVNAIKTDENINSSETLIVLKSIQIKNI